MFRYLSDMEVDDRWLDAYAEAAGHCAGYFIERVAAIRTKSSKLWSEGKRPYAETSERLVLHIPYGLVRVNKTLSVMEVSAEVAMRFHQLFDELPPLCQTALKVLTVASRGGYVFYIPSGVVYEVLNDLIADGVERDIYATILNEMQGLHMIKIDMEDGTNVLSFQCPAFADVAFDVSTPEQIKSIAVALAERLQPLVDENFVVPLVLARLHNIIGQEDSKIKALWLKGYLILEKVSIGWTTSEKNKWMECIDDEISSTGHNALDILGESFKYDKCEIKVVGKILPLIKVRDILRLRILLLFCLSKYIAISSFLYNRYIRHLCHSVQQDIHSLSYVGIHFTNLGSALAHIARIRQKRFMMLRKARPDVT